VHWCEVISPHGFCNSITSNACLEKTEALPKIAFEKIVSEDGLNSTGKVEGLSITSLLIFIPLTMYRRAVPLPRTMSVPTHEKYD
jgi:hypothetical protein